MQYLLLIYASEQAQTEAWERLSEEEQGQEMRAWYSYTDELQKAGAHVAGEALQPTGTATTVRVRNGKISTTDGPYVETKEHLAGFYLVDVDSRERAIEIAGRIPEAAIGGIEVRPILTYSALEM